MSQEQADAIKDLAAQIYTGLAVESGPDNWDWDPIAETAIEAAEAFTKKWEERYNPQTGVPSDPATPAIPVPVAADTPPAVPSPEQPQPVPAPTPPAGT